MQVTEAFALCATARVPGFIDGVRNGAGSETALAPERARLARQFKRIVIKSWAMKKL